MTIPESETDYCIGLRAQLAAANARADKARDVALGEAARIADGYGPVACDTDMRDAILALRDSPAETAPQPDLCSTSELQTARADGYAEGVRAALDCAILAITGDADGRDIYNDIKALVDASPAEPAHTVQESAKMLLSLHDGFLNGEPYDKTEADRLFLAASFGAQAFAICPQPEARPSAMLRAFLLALIDPTDPQLDYLRANNGVRAITGGGDE